MPEWLQDAVAQIGDFYLPGFCAALAVGLVAPLFGALLVAERSPLLALVVPEAAGLGVSFSYFAWPALVGLRIAGGDHPSHWIQMGGALLGVLFCLSIASLLRGRRSDAGLLLALVFVLAGAFSEIFLLESPFHEFSHDWLHHGRLLTILEEDARVVVATASVAAAGFLVLRRRLFLRAIDADQAALSGSRPEFDRWLGHLLVGIFVGVVVPEVGPDVVLASLLLPPLLLRGACTTLGGYLRFCSAAGVSGAAISFLLAFERDWPMGPAVAVSTVTTSLVFTVTSAVVRRARA